jgi:hypothetical protein
MPRDKFSSMRNTESTFGTKGDGLGTRGKSLRSKGGLHSSHKGLGRHEDESEQPQNQIPMDQEMADPDGRIPSERTREIEERLDVLDEKTKNVDLLKGRLSSLEALLTGGNPFSRQNMPILEEGRGIRLEKTVGRVKISTLGDPEASIAQIGLNLWELYQEDAGTNPLQVSMRSGVCVNTNTTSLYPTNSVINWTTADVTVSQTTLFWLKVSVAKATYQTYFEVWGVTAMVVQTGTTLPTDTLDIPAGTDGDLYFQIGSVTADGSAVTTITQDIIWPVTVVFPLGVLIDDVTCEEP